MDRGGVRVAMSTINNYVEEGLNIITIVWLLLRLLWNLIMISYVNLW